MLRRDPSVRVNSRLVPLPPTTGLARAGSTTTSEKNWTTGSLRGNPNASRFSRESTPDFGESDKDDAGRVGRSMPFSPPPSAGSAKPELQGTTTRRDASPPASPTKTYNQKRWSPTKNTWLSGAIEKLPGQIAASPTQNVFQPPVGSLNRSPTREGSFRKGETSPSRENSLRESREERIRARLAAQAVPRRNSQATEKPDLRSAFIKPTVNPKPLSLASKTEKDEAAAVDSATEPEPSPEEPKEIAKYDEPEQQEEETAVSEPTSAEEKRASNPPEKPAQKPVFERFTSNTTPVDPRELRTRQMSFDEKADVPFLGARSQLRPSRTQNYRAPDELKETILAGKAGLISKGGPQNYKAPNELKQRVLAAKGSLHASGGPQKLVRPDPLKEQVASARGALKQSGIVLSPTKPFVAPKPQSIAGATGSDAKPRPPMKEPSKSTFDVHSEKSDDPIPPKPVPVKQPSAPGRLEKPGGLADRFNPGLAGLIARGPMGAPRPGGMPGTSTATDSADDGEPKKGPELTHVS